jgi:hypothetical protein
MRRVAVLTLVTLVACARGGGTQADSGQVVVPDVAIDGNGCSVQPCSILPQCGCIGNTTCDVDAIEQDGTVCRPINVMGTEASTCNSPNECDRGFVCLGGVSFRSCKKYCTDDADCGTPRGNCIYTISTASGPIPDIPKVCSSNCDPTDTTAAGCPSNMKCTLTLGTENMVDTTIVDCTPAGTEVQGGNCTSGTSGVEARCAKGFQCTRFGTNPFFCRKVCTEPGTNSAQCGGQLCNGFQPALSVAGVTYGVCAP